MNKISTLNTTNQMILYIIRRAMFRALQNKTNIKTKTHKIHQKKQNQINNKSYQYNYSTGIE